VYDWDHLDEMPYRKKAVKKTPRKIDHKHDWEDVMVYNPNGIHYLRFTGRDLHYRIAKRCVICGQILPGGPQYEKKGNWYHPINPYEKPIYNLRDRYDVYLVDSKEMWVTRDTKYSLFKRKMLDNG